MPHEPSGSCPPVQHAPAKPCPACGQARSLAEFPTSPSGRPVSCCQGCWRTTVRLASRRRAAAMRLLIALHPQEWAGLLALVGGRHQATSHAPAVASMAERSARRSRRVAVVHAPKARAASLASSAALPRPPGDRLTRPSSRAADPPGNPPVIPPASDGGGSFSPLTGVAAGLAPLGGVVRPRRVVRFARLTHRRGRVCGGPAVRAACGGDLMPAMAATQGGGAA
jgi:hypothetical protein